MSMDSERPRLEHTRADTGADIRDLEDLSYHYQPLWTIRVDYRQPEAIIWSAIPADGGAPLTAESAAELRALLRQAKPVKP